MGIAIGASTEVVVIGAINRRSAVTAFVAGTAKRARSEVGRAVSSTGLAKSPLASIQNGPSTNAICHQLSHRRTVRTGTPST